MFNEIAAGYPQTHGPSSTRPRCIRTPSWIFQARHFGCSSPMYGSPDRAQVHHQPAHHGGHFPRPICLPTWWSGRTATSSAVIPSCCRPSPHDRGTGTATGRARVMAVPTASKAACSATASSTGNLDVVNVALTLCTSRACRRAGFLRIDGIRSTVEHCNSCPCTRAIPTWAIWSTPRSLARTRMRSRRPSPTARKATSGTCPICPSIPRTWVAAMKP